MYWGIAYAAYSFYCMWLIYNVNKNDSKGNNDSIPIFLGLIPVINFIVGITGTLHLIANYTNYKEVSKREQSKFVDFYRKMKDINPANVKDIRKSILKHGYITKELYAKYQKEIDKLDKPIVDKGQVLLDLMDEKPLPGLDDWAKRQYNQETNEENQLKRKEIS